MEKLIYDRKMYSYNHETDQENVDGGTVEELCQLCGERPAEVDGECRVCFNETESGRGGV